MAPYRTQLQILDLIDHTLESIPSVPIYEAVRPSSTSGYFCLGKGFSHQASMASALMEAAEMALVEQPLIATSVTLGSLAKDARIARPGWQEPLPCSAWSEPLAPNTAMLQGISLIDGGAVFVPEIDVLYRPGWLGSKHGPSTNGLASGNSWNEALTHGLCELLERDAMKRWMLRAVFFPPELVPFEIDQNWDDSLHERLDQIHDDGMHVAITRLPCPHGMTVIETQLIRPLAESTGLVFPGWGCHANGLIATKRALAESVQILAMHVAIRDRRLPPERLPGSTRQQQLRGEALGQSKYFERPLSRSLVGIAPAYWSFKCGPDHTFDPAHECWDEQELLATLMNQPLGHAYSVQVSPEQWPMVALRTVAPALQTPAGL